MIRDRFGVLPPTYQIQFDGGSVEPRPELPELWSQIKSCVAYDGFLYPESVLLPLIETETCRSLPFLYRLPATHELMLEHPTDITDARKGPAAFIVHLIGYLYEKRLQFVDWWFDGRLPLRRSYPLSGPRSRTEEFISHSFRTWTTWARSSRELITNIVFMHCRAISYRWDWERFMIEYMVFDGLYRLLVEVHHAGTKGGHGKRIAHMCSMFSIPFDAGLVDQILRLRNDLMHETLWAKGRPTSAAPGEAFLMSYHLHRLNQRLIPALLGFDTPLTRSAWWVGGSVRF